MRILAIDIGSANIKSVILESKFKRFDIVFHDISPVQDMLTEFVPGEQVLSAGQIATLRDVHDKYAQGVDHIVTNMPFSLYGSRVTSFPFRDKKKINAAVQFAIEDEIPFDLSSCIISSHVYPGKGKESHVLTGYAPLDPLSRFIDALDKTLLQVNVCTMEQAALASAFAREKGLPEDRMAIVNFGHRKSGIYLFRNGVPVLQRNVMIGGYQITKAIAEKYEISMAEAELAKVDRGFMPHRDLQINNDQRVFAEIIEKSLEPLFSDMQQSFMAFASRNNENIKNVYLTGGTSLIPGLPQYLSERWGKRVQHYEFTAHYPNLSVRPQKNSEVMLPIASALALSQLSGPTKSQINFRSGKLKLASQGLNLNLQQFIYPAKVALAVYACVMLSLLGQMIFLKSALTKKELQFEQKIQSVMGRVSSSTMLTLKTSPSKLKQNVEKKIDEVGAQFKGGGDTSFSALDVIRAMSGAVPKSATMEIKQMELSPSSLSMQVESPNDQTANAAITALMHAPYFSNPKAGPLETMPNNRKKFSFASGVNFKREAE